MHLLRSFFWIFTSSKQFPPAVNSTLQFSMVFSINLMNLRIPGTFWDRLAGPDRTSFCGYPPHCYILFRLVSLSLRMCWLIYRSTPVLIVLHHLFRSSRNSPQLIKEYISSLICAVSIFHIISRYIMGLSLFWTVPFWGLCQSGPSFF